MLTLDDDWQNMDLTPTQTESLFLLLKAESKCPERFTQEVLDLALKDSLVLTSIAIHGAPGLMGNLPKSSAWANCSLDPQEMLGTRRSSDGNAARTI